MNYQKKQERLLETAFKEHGVLGTSGGWMSELRDGRWVTLPWDKIPEPTVPVTGDTWGPWRLSTSHRVPSLGYGTYEIELSRIFSPEDFIDWVKHLHEKTWGRDPETMGNFVDAVPTIERYGYMLGKKHVPVSSLASEASVENPNRVRRVRLVAAEAG